MGAPWNSAPAPFAVMLTVSNGLSAQPLLQGHELNQPMAVSRHVTFGMPGMVPLVWGCFS